MAFSLTKPQQKEIVVRRSIPLEVWRYEPAYELEPVTKRSGFSTSEAALAAWVTGLTTDDPDLTRAAVSDTRWDYQQTKTAQDLELQRAVLDMGFRGKRLILDFKVKLGERVLIRMTSYEPATNVILTRFWYVLALIDGDWRITLPKGELEQAMVARFDPESPSLTISKGYELMTVKPVVTSR
jgi:hypothetical protein